MGRSWRLLGRSWAVLGCTWSLLGRSWAVIGGVGGPKVHFMKKCFWLERGAWKWWSWRVAGGSWVAVWWSWVALGGSWVAPGSLLAAVGSTSRFHSRFAGCRCGSQQTLIGGGDEAGFASPPSRLSTIEKQGLQDQQDQQGQHGQQGWQEDLQGQHGQQGLQGIAFKTPPHARWPQRGRRI